VQQRVLVVGRRSLALHQQLKTNNEFAGQKLVSVASFAPDVSTLNPSTLSGNATAYTRSTPVGNVASV
jgi:hypothetical protein